MADDITGDVTIEVTEDQTIKPVVAGEGGEGQKTPPAPKDATQDALDDLKKQVEQSRAREAAERARAEQAERLAKENAEAATSATAQVQDSRLSMISTAIDATTQKLTAAEREYADAMRAGDYDLAAKVQRKMAAESARLLTLENGKTALESKMPGTTEGAVRQPVRQPAEVSDDPVERIAATVSPKSAEWLRKHPAAAANVRKLQAAHNLAMIDDITPDTPEYFAAIEKTLGLTKDGDDGQQQTTQAQQPAGRRTASAPVASAQVTTARRDSGQSTVTLSSAERDIARSIYPEKSGADAERQYAADKLALIREGKIHAA